MAERDDAVSGKPHGLDAEDEDNPKTHPGANAEKDPDTWVTGDEPMTGPQDSYLHTLAHDERVCRGPVRREGVEVRLDHPRHGEVGGTERGQGLPQGVGAARAG